MSSAEELTASYDGTVPGPDDRPADLPEFMTWEEVDKLPREVSRRIELWEGRVMWMQSPSEEHDDIQHKLWAEFRRGARRAHADHPDRCWHVAGAVDVHFNQTKSDYRAPDIVVGRCLAHDETRYARDVSLVCEILSPCNTRSAQEAKVARYAKAGIPRYWEITLDAKARAITGIAAYGLERGPAILPDGVRSLHPANYILEHHWTPESSECITIEHPFPLSIPWTALAFG